MAGSNGQTDQHIDKRDFDANRPLLMALDQESANEEWNPEFGRSRPVSHYSRRSGGSRRGTTPDDGLLSDVVDGILERDRRKMHKEVVRVVSFVWGVITWSDCLSPASPRLVADWRFL